MVFSFFKKKDQVDGDVKQPSIKLPAGQAPQTTGQAAAAEDTVFGDTLGFTSTNIEVSETSEGLDPVVEEAAMLFANDQLDAACDIVASYLASHPNLQSDEPWLMLFELQQQKGARKAFDELAMQFVLKFERTAPVWRSGTEDHPQQAPQNQPKGNYFSYVGKLDASSNKLTELTAAADKGEKIRLDFGKFEAFSPDACLVLQKALYACRKAKTPVQFVAAERIIGWLQSQIEIMRPEQADIPYWLLLIEIHQSQGNQEVFENLAVDYAVTYEVSPPSWETPVLLQPSADTKEEEAEPEPESAVNGDIFHLRGVITDHSAEQLQRLAQFADDHTSVIIDTGELDRIDFISTGNLLNILTGFSAQNKAVTFDKVNALIFPLFRIMGINEMASVNRRK